MDGLWDNVRGMVDAAKDVLTDELDHEQVAELYPLAEADSPLAEELQQALSENEMLVSLCEKQKAELGRLKTELELAQDLQLELQSLKGKFRQSDLEKERLAQDLERRDQELKEARAAAAASVDHESVTEAKLLEKYSVDMEQKTAEIDRLRSLLTAEKAKKEDDLRLIREQMQREKQTWLAELSKRDADMGILREQVASLSQVAPVGGGASDVQLVKTEESAPAPDTALVAELQLKVEDLTQKLAAAEMTNGESRRAELEELAHLKELNELLEQKVDLVEEAESAARAKCELLTSHLLEREEELETMATHISANKEFIESLQVEVERLRDANDHVRELERLLEDKEKQILRTEKALSNLDEAVGQMTEEHRHELARKERLLREKFTDEYEAKLKLRQEEADSMTAVYKAQVEAREMEINRMLVTMVEKDKKVESLMKEVGPLREALNDAVRRLTEAVDKDQYSVDKRLVANLIFSYFVNDGGKKNEILCLLLRILDVPKGNRERIYASASGGWFGKTFTEDAGQEEEATPSIGDMWVQFLLKEAQQAEEEEIRKEGQQEKE